MEVVITDAEAFGGGKSLATSELTPSVASDDTDPADGELRQLLESRSFDDEPPPSLWQRMEAVITNLSGTNVVEEAEEEHAAQYGQPITPEQAAEWMPPGQSGLVWNALVVPDLFFVDGKLQKGLDKKDFDVVKQVIKPRRPSLPVTSTDLFSSLTKIEGPNGSQRFIFYGVLNGWPALRCLELIALEQRRNRAEAIPSLKELATGQILWTRIWSANEEGAKRIAPSISDEKRVHRARLRGAPWTSIGWSPDSPGFAFWYEAQRPDGPQLSYGTAMLSTVSDERCTYIHMISHRYAVLKESPKDKLTYHSVCLLEWDHGSYCTVIEVAYLNGMGGYKGKSNWFDDKDEKVTGLYRALPDEMICPWIVHAGEIRCYDVSARNLDEFKQYIAKYQGNTKRFIDPRVTFSHVARLTFRSKRHIAQYLLNYVTRDNSYGELKRNCQTFAADLCSFVAGKKDVAPFHPVNRVDYQNRTYLFLYDSRMYKTKQEKEKEKKQNRSTISAK